MTKYYEFFPVSHHPTNKHCDFILSFNKNGHPNAVLTIPEYSVPFEFDNYSNPVDVDKCSKNIQQSEIGINKSMPDYLRVISGQAVANFANKGIISEEYIKKSVYRMIRFTSGFYDEEFMAECHNSDLDEIISEKEYSHLNDQEKKDYLPFAWIDRESIEYLCYTLSLIVSSLSNYTNENIDNLEDIYFLVNIYS